MNTNDLIHNQLTHLNRPAKSSKEEIRPLKDALLRLSVSPVKVDRDAIARIERETGKDIQAIIQELDSVEITLKVLDEKPAQQANQLRRRISWAVFFGSLVGIGALFLLSPERLPLAIALGIVLGISLPFPRR
jgi:hypothetical protein